MTLRSAFDRDDGRPWVRWETPTTDYPHLEGCRERVEMTAWYDRFEQRLVVTVTRYDESLRRWEPCWAQVGYVDAGPFFAATDVTHLMARWCEEVIEMTGYDLPSS